MADGNETEHKSGFAGSRALAFSRRFDVGGVGRLAIPGRESVVFVCKTCAVLVAWEELAQHDEWHERLRRAVDEVGTLNE